MVRNDISNDIDLVQPTSHIILKNSVAKKPPPEPASLLYLRTLVMRQNDWPPKSMAYWLVRTGHNSTDVIINARDIPFFKPN